MHDALIYFVPKGLINFGVNFYFYQYLVPIGTVPEGHYIGRMRVIDIPISP
jgi:hypothetical protein